MRIIFLLAAIAHDNVVGKIVNTDVGTFVGFVDSATFNGTHRHLVKYIGIPYGEQTGGINRFSKPKPRSSLTEPYYANRTDLPNICPQLVGGYIRADVLDGRLSEDCLYLNIYAPVDTLTQKSKKYAVMVWIHGGSFSVGLSDQYPADVLSAYNDVIVVTINYRLNVFGFFATGDKLAPGNYGLWDQHLALKWVNNHIQHFGGDPEEVTIFGSSAGGASVVYQAMFPGNRGLFKRVIAQSAPPLSATQSNMLPFARFAGCNQSSSASVISCLRSISWEELSLKAEDPKAPARFVPVVDGEFIKQEPQKSISRPQSEEMLFYSSLDIIFGVNNLEAAMFMLPRYGKLVGVREEDISWIALNVTHKMEIPRPLFEDIILPGIIKRYFKTGTPNIVKDAIALKYSDWKDGNNPAKIRDMLMDLTSDLIFYIPAVRYANAHVQAMPKFGSIKNTFLYEYTFFSKMFESRPDWMKTGADHTDELLSVFGFSQGLYSKYHIDSYLPSPSDIRMSATVMKFWTNFAKTGNPNRQDEVLQWPQYTEHSRDYVRFTSDIPSFSSAEKHFGKPRVSFWLEIIPALISSANSVNSSLVTVNENKQLFSERLNLDSATAENIIIALAVVICVLFLCLLIVIILIIVMCKQKSRYRNKYKTSRTKVELV